MFNDTVKRLFSIAAKPWRFANLDLSSLARYSGAPGTFSRNRMRLGRKVVVKKGKAALVM